MRVMLRRPRKRVVRPPVFAYVAPLIAILLFIVGLTGCGESPGSQRSAAGSPREVTVAPEAVRILGSSESIARVADLVQAGDGRVWVLNSTSPWFVVFGADGRVQQAFGDQGGGPDRFGFPASIVRGPAAEVWAYDFTRHSLIRVSGEDRRTYALPQEPLPSTALLSFANAGVRPGPPWLEGKNGRFLVARARSVNPPSSPLRLWDAEIYSLRPDTSGVLAYERDAAIADLLGDPASRYAGATTLMPYPLWTQCEDGPFTLYDPLRNLLRRFTPAGQEIDPFELPAEQRVQLTADRMFGMMYRQLREEMPAGQRPDSVQMHQQLEGQLHQFIEQSAGRFPEYADLRCAPDGTPWLQPFDVETGLFGRGPAWLRFGEDGTRTAVTFPTWFRVFAFASDRIWGTMQDTLGLFSIAWVGTDALR
jgi:hypothetical protein